jgi:hypothetical protein
MTRCSAPSLPVAMMRQSMARAALAFKAPRLVLFLLAIVAGTNLFSGVVAAQSDLCWRESYPSIPGEWAGTGSVVEAGNRFQFIPGATLQLWKTTENYEEAQQSFAHRRTLPATLVETVRSEEHGSFRFETLLPRKQIQIGSYEIRVHMPGRQSVSAYTEIGKGLSPQWLGRGIKIALSFENQGCSRIYAAGLDDTDCGFEDCENLPAGPTKIVDVNGSPLRERRLAFYQHWKKRPRAPELSLTTNPEGVVLLPALRGCFDIDIEGGGSMHLCFRNKVPTRPVTVVLPPGRNE